LKDSKDVTDYFPANINITVITSSIFDSPTLYQSNSKLWSCRRREQGRSQVVKFEQACSPRARAAFVWTRVSSGVISKWGAATSQRSTPPCTRRQ